MEEDYSIPKEIYIKNDFVITRQERNKYYVNFSMQNNKTYLDSIINFNIMTILYEMNKDIFDDYKVQIINEEEADVYFLIKHFFSDLGLPQKYFHMHVKKVIDKESNVISFACENSTIDHLVIPNKGDIANIDNIFINCHFTSKHNVFINYKMFINPEVEIPAFMEKIMGIVASKIFLKTKQFIENINNNV